MSASKTATKPATKKSATPKSTSVKTHKQLIENLQDFINAKLEISIKKVSTVLNAEQSEKLNGYVFTQIADKKPKEKRMLKIKKDFECSVLAIINYIALTYKLPKDYDKEFFKRTYLNENSGFFSILIKKYIDTPFDFRGNKSHDIITTIIGSIDDGTNNDVLYAELLAKFFNDFGIFVVNKIISDIVNNKIVAFEVSRNHLFNFVLQLIASEEIGDNMLAYVIIEKNNKLIQMMLGLESNEEAEKKKPNTKKKSVVKKQDSAAGNESQDSDIDISPVEKKKPAKKETKRSKVKEDKKTEVSENALDDIFNNMVLPQNDEIPDNTGDELFNNLINGFDKFDSTDIDYVFK